MMPVLKMCFTLAFAYALALASVIKYDHVSLQFGASLTDDTSSVNYNCNMFIIQATRL